MCELAANAIVAYQLQTRTIHNDSTTITFKGPPCGRIVVA
jgi:hypothetical protein